MPNVPRETALSQTEKNAYRYLLYHAMLDIRSLCYGYGPYSRNPWFWLLQYRRSRIAGALTEWLHNLAYFAATDFKGFDADWFWEEYDSLVSRYSDASGHRIDHYRKTFDGALVRRDKE